MSPIPLGILALAGAAGGGAYELIESNILTSSASSVTFSSIPQDYKHLQIRATTRSNQSGMVSTIMGIRANGDTTNNYSSHSLLGRVSYPGIESTRQANTSSMSYIDLAGNSAATGNFTSFIVDVLDYSSISKYTTIRTLSGIVDTDVRIRLSSGNWRNTSTITNLTFFNVNSLSSSFIAGSRFSLYGIRG